MSTLEGLGALGWPKGGPGGEGLGVDFLLLGKVLSVFNCGVERVKCKRLIYINRLNRASPAGNGPFKRSRGAAGRGRSLAARAKTPPHTLRSEAANKKTAAAKCL